ncbi:T9SS type A sorting domain-containing protein [Flavobacterium sp.]|uniref:DUF7619 domain-containing protein n=1 Tax=Flavobacterium sp. TaxID=239 RepID=UPI003752311A
MKNIFFLFVLFTFGSINAQINIPDANFKAKLLAANTSNSIAIGSDYTTSIVIDTNNNGEIEIFEAQQVYRLDVSNSNIASLEGLSSFTNLSNLFCNDNQLATLDLSSNINLFYIDCSDNLLTTLDTSSIINLVRGVNCNNNQLTTLNLKGIDSANFLATITGLSYANNPNLNYICIRDIDTTFELTLYNFILYYNNEYGLTNCEVNTYCSFNPGGVYYTIQGNTKYDININGCDNTDIDVPNIKFNLNNGTTSGIQIANTTGSYLIPMESGVTTITPILENPSYFNISPTFITVNFPTTASPFIQNFCISPNGNHNDLEVALIPTSYCRVGFDSEYKIKFKNNGTQAQSGIINLNFEDAVLDFVSSNPSVSSQVANTLTWNFSNLQPFETREINLILNINSSTDSPPVNQGDILNFSSTITGLTDETPSNNLSDLAQYVWSSFDPNDKTCLEGETLSPTKIGDYVHYKIRFENTGTANALNIVVKDTIDTSKFDINTLQFIDSSHSCITKISDGNIVEFIFEGINLPFDDTNNDGYIVFKIKTKNTLVVGNQITNGANIYFDYNAPIATNTATSVFQTLNFNDFNFLNDIILSPVPVKNTLNISSKNTTSIVSIKIYNLMGQLMQTIINPSNEIDVSVLKSGNYFINITTEFSEENIKFLKE